MHSTSKRLATVKAGAELSIDDLAVIIRREIQEADICWRNALRQSASALEHAMAAGDALIAVQPKVEDRGINWKKWLKDNCFVVAVRTAQFYQQLARSRSKIEEEVRAAGELSLREARRLIAKPRKNSGGGGNSGSDVIEGEIISKPETLSEHWRRLRQPNQDAEFFDLVREAGGITKILEYAEFRRDAQDRFDRVQARLPAPSKRKRPDKPFRHTLELTASSSREERANRFRH